ncbi:NADP-dependent isocitrate dehydrogenase [Olivibacter sp. SDN3]|uniref:NADP-dependent isocitrate dehydrogenase n=1 Tax=Olivibacter sp. SDN3 TaxID=2764720 RepID=UPI0016510735|nr:NADP-dependent isocitrate dehydrogenase [Olivibacter sp. SDN3]QNL48427.1 NADP-dependent isocitrate dehydrogenase [Olivibacter sp. SDN3]
MADRITSNEKGQLSVPAVPIIPFIIGDGIGPDIWKASVRVFDHAIEKAYVGKRRVEWKEILAGQKAYDTIGEWLPDESISAMRNYVVSIKGPLTTPVGGGIRSLNVAIRQALDLYVCQRPLSWIKGVPSPVKHPGDVDMIIFRENTEDIYAGIEFEAGSEAVKKLTSILMDTFAIDYPFKKETAIGIKPVSKAGSVRLIRAAIEYAIQHGLPSVSLVHKGNIMKYTEGAFKNWGYELAEEVYPDKVFTWNQWEKLKVEAGESAANDALKAAEEEGRVIIKDVIADNFLQQILLNPKDYAVIATLNLNGDYISDALAAIVGGIGIAPGANINYSTGHAVFEATHGTAPRFADTDTMNPSSVILSGVMMFDYLGWREVSEVIKTALRKTINEKRVTVDFFNQMSDATLLKTSEFADAIIGNMAHQQK